MFTTRTFLIFLVICPVSNLTLRCVLTRLMLQCFLHHVSKQQCVNEKCFSHNWIYFTSSNSSVPIVNICTSKLCFRSTCCQSMTTGCKDGWPCWECGWPHLCGGQGGGQPDGHHPCPPGGLGHVRGGHLPRVPPDLLHAEHRHRITIIITVILHTITVSVTTMWPSSCPGSGPTLCQIYSGKNFVNPRPVSKWQFWCKQSPHYFTYCFILQDQFPICIFLANLRMC